MARQRSQSPAGEMAARLSGSPPPVLSKRDKRRTMLAERLGEMVSTFSANLRPHYEAQANAVQVDITLIMRANPYQNKTLDDDPEEISKLVNGVVGNKIPAEPIAEEDFVAGAGKMYSDFLQSCNDSAEERDINLTLLANKYESSRTELDQRHQFHIKLAHEEHRLLAETLRQRLVQQVSQKRARLMKEKEQLDLGDSNSLLLHANQFSNVNPASPSGAQKRSTRNTGRRGGDADDSGSLMQQENKRKRKALFEEVEGQSPAPGPSRSIETTINPPWKEAKSKTVYHQYEAPLYSIDRLFTEKELAMNMNTAAIAATNFLVKLKSQNSGQSNGNGNGINGNHADAEGGSSSAGAVAAMNDEVEDDATPAAAEMERGYSQTYHQTRGATRNALSDLANAAAVKDFPFGAAVPTYIAAIPGAKANGAPVTATPLTTSEVENDITLVYRDSSDVSLLEKALSPIALAEYKFSAPSLLPDAQDGYPSSLLPTMGGVPMSTQSSAGGNSDTGLGGVPMSRHGSAMGSVGMRRTASGLGSLLEVPETGRRGRARAA